MRAEWTIRPADANKPALSGRVVGEHLRESAKRDPRPEVLARTRTADLLITNQHYVFAKHENSDSHSRARAR